jgi:hypothetical protein
MDVCEVKRLGAWDEENAKLKKLLAEQMLDAAALRELLSKIGRARRQARSGLRMRLCVAGCEISPTSGGVSATAGQETGCRPLQERLGRVLSDVSR